MKSQTIDSDTLEKVGNGRRNGHHTTIHSSKGLSILLHFPYL